MGPTPAFSPDRIRNVVVLGHAGTGKSSLVDACCFAAGSTRRRGSVADGTALTMCTPEEIAHSISMNCSVAFAEWDACKINFLDTPGYPDFAGEALAGARVADGALLVLSAAAGADPGTERIWELVEAEELPTLLYLAMLDRPGIDFERVLDEIRTTLTSGVIPLEIPLGNGEQLRGCVDLLTGRSTSRAGSGSEPLPELAPEDRERVEQYRAELIEAIAATDDLLLERYLDGEPIRAEEAMEALRRAVSGRVLVPLLCGMPEGEGSAPGVLDRVVTLLPSPEEGLAIAEAAQDEGLSRARKSPPLRALVFKTTSEPHVGELSYFRIFSGTIVSGQEVYNLSRQRGEKFAHLSIPLGRERYEVGVLGAGDIGVVAKLRETRTNDTLGEPGEMEMLRPIDFPEPDLAVALSVEIRGEEDRLAQALALLQQEDPSFTAEYDPEIGQTIARACGELHLEVQLERMRRKYNVAVRTSTPRISYRETIRSLSEAQGRHRKQSGGRGQFGDCHVRLRPRPRGSGYAFVDAVVGGVIPGKFIPAVDKGIQEAAQRGVLSGSPMVDFEAECFDGSYHTVDSSEIAFKIAGSLAFQRAAASADPVLLEPVLAIEVTTPESFLGEVMGDLNQRRGRILGLEARGGKQIIRALVPEAELDRYATRLRSLTQGRGAHRRRFHAFEEVPTGEAERVIASLREAQTIEALAR